MSALRSGSVVSAVVAATTFLHVYNAPSRSAQGTPEFAPGARTIVNLNFAAVPTGDVAKVFTSHSGKLDVVDKNGVRMLRASSPSDFVLRLPESLPKDFTLEFDLIP